MFSGIPHGVQQLQSTAGERTAMSQDFLMTTYGRQPVSFTHGEGAWLVDTEGRRYLDALSGISVCNLGHAHPAVTRAICEQAGKVLHTSNLYRIPAQEQAAEALCRVSGMDRVFFANSGAEANEAAIKLARLHGHRKGIESPAIVVMDGAFHGRTMATLTATGNRKIQAGFEPLLSGFIRAPFGDIEAVRNIARNNPKVVAVLAEPVQGEGGIRVTPPGYLAQLRELCDQQGWLLMLDEVQTGNGRTGHYFAYQGEGIVPDVVTTAKGLGNGVPIGACLAHGAAADVFHAGNHGSTFGGNPLACAAALAVIETIERDQLCARATALGARMAEGFRAAFAGNGTVVDIRHRGLMLGVELDRPCAALVGMALEKGLLINVTAEKVIRLLPPLTLTDDEADQIVAGVVALVAAFAAQP